jgi:hypothetical protein
MVYGKSSAIFENVGNDTIDRYPSACREISKILCVSDRIFKRIQKDWQGFLKQTQSVCYPKAKITPKTKIKPKKIKIPQNHYELVNDPDSINNTYNHRKGRMNDWHSTYGQGMYD